MKSSNAAKSNGSNDPFVSGQISIEQAAAQRAALAAELATMEVGDNRGAHRPNKGVSNDPPLQSDAISIEQAAALRAAVAAELATMENGENQHHRKNEGGQNCPPSISLEQAADLMGARKKQYQMILFPRSA